MIDEAWAAHPRSRGENARGSSFPRWHHGSSPLTRGKRLHLGTGVVQRRLIPAHAGKTCSGAGRWSAYRAHPRSRGENVTVKTHTRGAQGSSPLTRGKPESAPAFSRARRLIPAHAGKTGRPELYRRPPAAHPRSRGENGRAAAADFHANGSSPLTRGKPRGTSPTYPRPRLIPAHAGKTSDRSGRSSARPAHPRSRGENVSAVPPDTALTGSSPLTRGKRLLPPVDQTSGRLIPAHAGKTAW